MGRKRHQSLFSYLLFGLIIFATLLAPIANVSAKKLNNSALYKNNSILFYDPNEDLRRRQGDCPDGQAPTSDPSTIQTSDDNQAAALAFLIQNGYSNTAAAAIVGNWVVESGVNPRKIQGGAIVDESFVAFKDGHKTYNGAFGIVQWDSAGRVQGLQTYADEHNLSVSSLGAQLGFALQEMTGSYVSHAGPDYLNTLSLDVAVFEVRRYYETPQGMLSGCGPKGCNDYAPSSLSDINQTQTAAAYTEWKNAFDAAGALLGIDTSSVSIDDIADSSQGCANVGDDALSPINTDELVFYSQCDPSWASLYYGTGGINVSNGYNTICQSGCGPTSFAVIATNLLRKSITPDMTSDVAGKAGEHEMGVGSKHSITNTLSAKYGLKSEKISSKDEATINSYLEKGAMIHVSGKGAAPFTEGGHYIAIVAKVEDGKWLIGDSSKNGPSGIYSPSTVLAGMSLDSLYAVSLP